MKKTKIKFISITLILILILSFLPFFQNEANASFGSRPVTFSESLSRSQSQTITIPDFVRVTSVSVDTGTVSYTTSGNNVTVNVNNGTWTSRESYYDPYLYSKSETATSGSYSDSFSSTYNYNSGGYSGSLPKSGSSYYTGSYTPSSQKYVSGSLYDSGTCPNGTTCRSKADAGMYSSWYYNSGGYYGTVYETYYSYWQSYPNGSTPPAGTTHYSWTRDYSYGGTVTKDATDSRYYYQNYAGTVYQGGTNYRNYKYAYNVTVNYEYNVAPTVSLTSMPTISIGSNGSFNLNTADVDASDTLSYDIKAGTSYGNTKYNTGLATPTGVSRGTKSITFNSSVVPYADLTWNGTNGRYERIVYLLATVNDDMNYSNSANNSFVVYNYRPVISVAIPNMSNYRVYSDSFNANSYFSDSDGHTLSYSATSSNSTIASVSVTGSTIKVQPLKPGSTTITVTANDGYGQSVSQSFTYNTINSKPVISAFSIDKTLVPAGSTFTFSGTVTDLESDSVTISTTLDGVTKSTTVSNGNASWSISFQTDEVEEGKYQITTFSANDGYDIVTQDFNFTLDIDKTDPFVWALSQDPTKPTNGDVMLQINVGDTYSGVKNIEMPDGSIVSKLNSTYKVSANGDYTFIVTDKAGNQYTHVYTVSNFDNTKATFEGLTLTETGNIYKVTVRANDQSGIEQIVLNTGEVLKLSNDKAFYYIDDAPIKPSHVLITDKAGNVSNPETFLPLPIFTFDSSYSTSKTMKEDVLVSLSGTDKLSYKLGVRDYSCSESPCEIKMTKNTELTGINSSINKASIKIANIDNIDKTPNNLVLLGKRDATNELKIDLNWNLSITNSDLKCSSVSGLDTFTPTTNNYSFIGSNSTYECNLAGTYQGNNVVSNTATIYPNYATAVVGTTPVDNFQRKTINHTVFIEKNSVGQTYFLNINRSNTDDNDIPIPDSLLN